MTVTDNRIVVGALLVGLIGIGASLWYSGLSGGLLSASAPTGTGACYAPDVGTWCTDGVTGARCGELNGIFQPGVRCHPTIAAPRKFVSAPCNEANNVLVIDELIRQCFEELNGGLSCPAGTRPYKPPGDWDQHEASFRPENAAHGIDSCSVTCKTIHRCLDDHGWPYDWDKGGDIDHPIIDPGTGKPAENLPLIDPKDPPPAPVGQQNKFNDTFIP